MAGSGARSQVLRVDGARVVIIEARYYERINDLLLAGVKRSLELAGCAIDHVIVPGALEVPPAIALFMKHGDVDGFVAVGCVIRGETTHYDLVANESSRGLTDLATRQCALIGNAILTVENEGQALVRADPEEMDKGGHAARAVIQLIDLRRRFEKDL